MSAMYRKIGMKSQDFNRETHPDSPFPPFPVRLFPMRKLTATICLTVFTKRENNKSDADN